MIESKVVVKKKLTDLVHYCLRRKLLLSNVEVKVDNSMKRDLIRNG